MVVRAAIAAVACALGALVAVAGSPLAGGGTAHAVSFNYGKIEFADVRGGAVRGVVVAGQPSGKRRAKVYVSLHGLPLTKDGVSGTYLVVASQKDCDADVDGADFLVWRTGLTTSEPDAFKSTSVPLRSSLESAKSVRVYAIGENGDRAEAACGPTAREDR